MYQPQLGRFLSQDPLFAGQPDILFDNDPFGNRLTAMRNLYGYCGNNPVNCNDPSGLIEPITCVGIGIAIVLPFLCGCRGGGPAAPPKRKCVNDPNVKNSPYRIPEAVPIYTAGTVSQCYEGCVDCNSSQLNCGQCCDACGLIHAALEGIQGVGTRGPQGVSGPLIRINKAMNDCKANCTGSKGA